MTYNIVLDIDHTLAFHHVKDIPQANFIKHKGAILSTASLKTHYIYPGVLEFIKWLYSTENFKVSFFSKGAKKRNEKFVQVLLQQALPEEQYEAIKSKVRIFSHEDLSEISALDTRKDLRLVLEGDDRLEDAILIDDRPGNSMFGQEANLLQVPVVDWEHYDKLTGKVEYYDSRGTRLVKCVLDFTDASVMAGKVVEEGRGIHIHRLEDDFEIKFVNLDDETQVRQLSFLDNPELFAKLVSHYYTGIACEDRFSIIEDQELAFDICKLVDSFGGVTTKICRQANRICYVAGVLFTSLFHAKEYNMYFSEALEDIQFIEKDGLYQKDFKDDRLYLVGAVQLMDVNPAFELISPHSYHQYNRMPDCKMESMILQDILGNEYK